MGWYYDIEGTEPFNFSKKFMDSKNITLYAKWGMFVFVEGANVEKNLTETQEMSGEPHNKGSCFTGGGSISINSL